MATVAAISTRLSVRDDTSNDRQLEQCKAYVKAKGWTVGPIFQKRGITGTGKKDRPQWRKLTVAVEGGDVDAVLRGGLLEGSLQDGRAHNRTKSRNP
jgi:DNA invertase Pin-like site-specific DNA recombinase